VALGTCKHEDLWVQNMIKVEKKTGQRADWRGEKFATIFLY
jgi:hypothetical protein